MNKKLRVIEWTTGRVGKLATRGILDDPRLELVGVYAWSPDKVGQDAGELCGRPPCGVKATDNVDALAALKADAVIYTPFEADLTHLAKMLESGADVISTNLLLNIGGARGETGEKLEAACQRGGSSLLISGISPGWIESTTVGLTAVCGRVESVYLSETSDCSVYENPPTWNAMGMGMPDATPEVRAHAQNWLSLFYDAVQRMAAAMEIKLDDIEFFVDFAKTSERVDLGWFLMEEGTIGAVSGGWHGKVNGRTVITYKLTWYLTDKLKEGWKFSEEAYHLVIKGEPNVNLHMGFTAPPHWGNFEWGTLTAMPAVNAIFNVQACRPGILSLKDVGLITAPAGLWPTTPA